MRHHLLAAALVLLALLALASPVQASEWVEGDGFRFRLPDGFQRVAEGQAGNLQGLNMSFGGGVFTGPDIEMEMQAYARDLGTTDQGVLGVVRMTLGGDLADKLKGQFNSQAMATQMQQGVESAAYQGAANTPEVTEVTTTTLGASHDAVQMVMEVEDPQFGAQVLRMAFANHESSIYIFMLSSPAGRADADGSLWQAFTTTIKLSNVGGIGRLLRTYWPYLVGGAVLLLLFVLLRSRPATSRGRVSYDAPSTAGGSYPDGASFSRAMDGLPMYREPDAPGEGGVPPTEHAAVARSPVSAPSPAERPVLRRSQPAPPPGATPTTETDPATLVRRPPARSEPDLAAPPPSAAPAATPPSPSADPASPRRVVPAQATNVAKRVPSKEAAATEADDDGLRFQRNQDFMGS